MDPKKLLEKNAKNVFVFNDVTIPWFGPFMANKVGIKIEPNPLQMAID